MSSQMDTLFTLAVAWGRSNKLRHTVVIGTLDGYMVGMLVSYDTRTSR